jgi:hypothetical protein
LENQLYQAFLARRPIAKLPAAIAHFYISQTQKRFSTDDR